MLQYRFIPLFLRIKEAIPEMVFSFFGDINQIGAVVEGEFVRHNFLTSDAFKTLAGNTQVQLLYKMHRYDAHLFADLTYFLKHSRLPPSLRNKKAKDCWLTITATNLIRPGINKYQAQRFVDEFKCQTRTIDGYLFGVGMPVISLLNLNHARNRKPKEQPYKSAFPWTSSDVFNSEIFTIKKFGPKSVFVQENYLKPLIEVPIHGGHFSKIFEHAFALTVDRVQGSEIAIDFCIVQLALMSKNHFYTALSRGKTREKVHFAAIDKEFEPQEFDTVCKTVLPIPPKRVDGQVYLLDDSTVEADGTVKTATFYYV
jgi:hypothetical protein